MNKNTQRNNSTQKKMLNIVLFGPPGAGKGTQSQLLIDRYQLKHISTGDILRSQIAQGTELGLEAKRYMDNGNLVPDDLVIGMIDQVLRDNMAGNGVIFDGFPRTVAQADALDEVLAALGQGITAMVALEVSEDELIQRLVLRGQMGGRSDDNVETITKRIQVYKTETVPVAEYYQNQDKLHSIYGLGDIGSIFSKICHVIDELVIA
ncbi:MAG: adenylate kinase [Bacteroidota bacterium]|nr:adenylate kinase [Bacteroidota bacterium]